MNVRFVGPLPGEPFAAVSAEVSEALVADHVVEVARLPHEAKPADVADEAGVAGVRLEVVAQQQQRPKRLAAPRAREPLLRQGQALLQKHGARAADTISITPLPTRHQSHRQTTQKLEDRTRQVTIKGQATWLVQFVNTQTIQL